MSYDNNSKAKSIIEAKSHKILEDEILDDKEKKADNLDVEVSIKIDKRKEKNVHSVDNFPYPEWDYILKNIISDRNNEYKKERSKILEKDQI